MFPKIDWTIQVLTVVLTVFSPQVSQDGVGLGQYGTTVQRQRRTLAIQLK